MKHRLVVVLATLLIFTLTLTISFGRSVSEINNQINQTQQEIAEGQDKIDELNDQIEEMETEISRIQGDINALTGEIATLQVEIDMNQQELDQKKAELETSIDNLNGRLRNMYKNGSIGFIDVILSSGNVTELISNFIMVERIYQSDKDLVASLQVQVDEIEAKQTELDDRKAELDAKMAELSTQRADLDAGMAAVNANKSEVANHNAELQHEVENLEAERAQVSSIINSNSGSQYQGSSSGAFVWPVPSSGTVTSQWGSRYCPYHGYESHSGIDISASYGANIIAADNGKVISAGWLGSYGNAVIISHGNNLYTLYGHCSSLAVSSGQTVSKGQVVAYVGSTGNSTGNHCHFEVRLGGSGYGNDVNPYNYL